MLSNPPTTIGLHSTAMPTLAQRRRQHRRQNSTPTAFDTVKIQKHLPPSHSNQMSGGRPAGGHRRGLSLDTRRQHMRQRSTASAAAAAAALATSSPSAPGQDFTTHHVLREAQQQCLQAGPGTQYAYMSGTTQQQPATAPPTTMSHEAFLMAATHNDPQAQRFDPNCFDPNAIPFDQYLIMQKNRANFEQSMAAAAAANNELFSGNSALSTPTYVEFHETPAQAQGWTSEGEVGTVRRTARRISNGIMDRVAKFEHLTEEIQRPSTPPAQNVNDCHPQPQIKTEAPGQVTCDESRLNRFSEGYDESMEETIKPTRRSGQRKQPTAFDEMRRQAEQQEHQIQAQQAQQPQLQRIAPAGPVPQRANTMPAAYQGIGGHDFMDMNNFSHEFMKIRHGYDGMDFGVVDGMPHINQPHPFDNLPDLRPHDSISQPNSPSRSGASNRASPHRRTESLASIASAASIAGINIEETRTETGITVDDIATYISGPDAVDNKWLCLFEGCGKRFGRKENIKSHVQTHLNDRQYQCPTCNKCFVRQHDLKRHAKIHTGIKPYPCECGNSFARHDALTRHRQRGMCIGAFDGIVRKVVKRGRPRKHRPDMESRMDKASRSRRKNNLSISSVSSSQSGYSDSSSMPGSPHNEYDMLDDDGFDLMDVAIDSSTINGVPPMLGGTSSSQMTAMPADISDLQQYANSPESHHSYVSPEAIMEAPQTLPPHPTSPAKSIASQYNEPPELSQSSSPPPSRLFDVEPNTSITDESNLSAFVPIASTNQTLPGSLTVGMGDQEDEMLLKAFTNDERMLHLDRDSSMFMMSKFDEEYAVSMLNAESDMFFGS